MLFLFPLELKLWEAVFVSLFPSEAVNVCMSHYMYVCGSIYIQYSTIIVPYTLAATPWLLRLTIVCVWHLARGEF